MDDFNNKYEVQEIEMDKDFIEKLYYNLEKEEQVIKEREVFIESFLQFQTDEEKLENIFRDGLKLFNENKYHDAIEKFR